MTKIVVLSGVRPERETIERRTRAGLLAMARELGEQPPRPGHIGTVDYLLNGYPGHYIDPDSPIDPIVRIRIAEELHRLRMVIHDPGDEDRDARRLRGLW